MRLIAGFVLGLALVAGPALAQEASPPPQLSAAVDPAKTLAEGQAFMAQNAKAPGVVTTASGVQYKVVKAAPKGAAAPKVGDIIKVNYEGKLVNGTVFDSSFERGKAAIMPLDGLVPGWMEIVPLMHVGDEWTLWLPAAQGYGERGAGPIPPNSVLVFRLQLVGMLAVD